MSDEIEALVVAYGQAVRVCFSEDGLARDVLAARHALLSAIREVEQERDRQYDENVDRIHQQAAAERENAALREALDKDRERLDWLEKQKWGHGRGGWEVKKPESGWALQIIPRGPWHSLRAAIDAAMASRAVPPTTES